MNLELSIKDESVLSVEEKNNLDMQVDNIIKKHRENRFEINKLVFDSVNTLTVSKARSNELKAQGPLKRIWGSITGNNKKLTSEINHNLVKYQYCSQQIIQKLAEQNLMSFELITAINNKLNSSILEIDDELNNIYTILKAFFKQNRSNLIKLENRIDKLEQNVKLLNWVNSIEFHMSDGVEYCELNKYEKIYRIGMDFYEITNGIWTTSDLLLLKTAVTNIGLSVKEEIKYVDFIRYVSENNNLYIDFIGDKCEDVEKMCLSNDIIITSVIKSKYFDENGKYIINVLKGELNTDDTKSEELKYLMLREYIKEKNNINIDKLVNVYEFILELLVNIYNYKMDDVTILDKEELDEQDSLTEDVKLKGLIQSAENGDLEAQNNLGDCYYYGEGVEQNYSKAIKWYKKSAEQGNCWAQNNLGNCYYNGKGVEQNYSEATKWYMKSAEQGYDWAQDNLGDCYYYGEGVEQNYSKAIKWYKKSAEQGNATSQNNLGHCYSNGYGIKKDDEEAVKWYKESAEQGNCWAQNNLGNYYYNGIVVNRDYEQSAKWYKKSAEQGCHRGQYNIAACYYDGEGVNQDYNEARKWYKKSAEQGNERAKNKLEYFEHSMKGRAMVYKDGMFYQTVVDNDIWY